MLCFLSMQPKRVAIDGYFGELAMQYKMGGHDLTLTCDWWKDNNDEYKMCI